MFVLVLLLTASILCDVCIFYAVRQVYSTNGSSIESSCAA